MFKEGTTESHPLPQKTIINSWEELKAYADRMHNTGWKFDRNMPDSELQSTIDFYWRGGETTDVALSTAYTQADPKNNWEGRPLEGHTGVWTKFVKKD